MDSLSTYKSALTNLQKAGLLVFVIVALFHGMIANDKYIVSGSDAGISFFSNVDNTDWGIRAPIPYSAKFMDKNNRSVSPFGNQDIDGWYKRHWIGTDKLGRDVLAGLIYGSFVALQVGLGTILFSLLIGFIMAYLSGYFGDSELRVEKKFLLFLIPLSLLSVFYIIYSKLIFSIVILLFTIAVWSFAIRRTSNNKSKSAGIPFDLIIFRIIDILHSIPGLFLILILLSLFNQKSIWNVVMVIVLLRWPVITRHLRADILKIKQEDFVTSAKALGLSNHRVFIFHILPLAISPVIIVSAFGFATAILMESTLSFLGIGLPLDQVTWGSLIKQARLNFSDWWLALFPGLAIYFIIVLFNSIGERLVKLVKNEQ